MARASGDTTGLKEGSPEWWAEYNYAKNTSTTTNTNTNTGSNNNSGSSSGSSGSSSSSTAPALSSDQQILETILGAMAQGATGASGSAVLPPAAAFQNAADQKKATQGTSAGTSAAQGGTPSVQNSAPSVDVAPSPPAFQSVAVASAVDTFTGWRVDGNEFAYFENGKKQYGVALDNPDFVAEVNKNKVLAPSAGENNWRVAAGQYLKNRASAGAATGPSGSSSADTFTGWRVDGNEFAYFENGKKQYGVALDNPDFVAEVNKNKVLAPSAGENNWRVAAGQYLKNRASAGAATGGAATGGAAGGAATTGGAGASDGPTGVEAYNQALAYKTYIDTLATLIKQTGQLHTFNGLDARGMPIYTPLLNGDGSPKRPQDYDLTQAQIDKYAADIVFQKAQAASEYAAQASKLTGDTGFVYMYKGNNADGSPIVERQTDAQGKPQLSAAYQKQLFDANMTRQTALASMIANPTTYVAGAALANQMGARMGSTPVASRPSYVMASGVGNATAGGTASTGSTATGYPSVMPSAPTGADAMTGRSAVTLDVSPSMIAALTGNRVAASGNPTGVYGGAVSLPDATPLSGDFGKINIADWRRMNDTTQKQYASLALANQPGLTSDDLTKRIAAQAPGTAAWS